MRNPWILAQLAVAAALLVIALLGILGTSAFDLPELTFTFQGAIQSFFIFPGLVISLVANALIMRGHRSVGVSTTEKVLLIVEGVLIALLLVFHFWQDEAGNNFGFAILTWPVIILLAVAIAAVAIFRAVSARQTSAPIPAPAAPAGAPE
jgi:hypothetical protein